LIADHDHSASSLQPKFELGNVVITSNALAQLGPTAPLPFLIRHLTGDWGELDAEDKQANDRALETEGRLVSRYTTPAGVAIYIITEWDRSYTTIMLPEDY